MGFAVGVSGVRMFLLLGGGSLGPIYLGTLEPYTLTLKPVDQTSFEEAGSLQNWV